MKRFCFFLLSFIFLSVTVQAQNNLKKPVKECNALLTRQLVEQQAEESKSVEETDKRINILLRVADFLWAADEETARKYFADAFQIAQARFQEKGLETLQKKESRGLVIPLPDYRFSVISAVARRDGEWAKKLIEIVLKEFDEDKEKDKRNSFDRDREVGEILSIASKTAKDNPNLALTLARRAMRYPLIRNWYFTMYQMAGNNQALADQIYGELLTNYADSEIARLLYLSAYPFGSQRIVGVEKYSLGVSIPANFSPNPNLKRQFLLTLFRRMMKLTTASPQESQQTETPDSTAALIALNEIEPTIAQQVPDLAQTFSKAKIHVNSIVSGAGAEDARKTEEQNNSFNNSFEAQLEAAEKADDEGTLTEMHIFNLVKAAKTEDDYKKAESWLDKIEDENTRESTSNHFYFQRSKLATREKRFDEARKFANKVVKIEHRAVLYFDITEAKMKEPMTKLESLDTLLEVFQMAQKSPDSIEKAQVLLGLAFMYEKVDHYNALDSLSNAIKTANNLENPNLFTNNIMQQIIGKEFSFFMILAVPGFDVSETFYALSQKDFQGTLTYTTSFSDKYLRTLAVLATVRDCEKNVKPVKIKPKTK